jgi:hypothetical protein
MYRIFLSVSIKNKIFEWCPYLLDSFMTVRKEDGKILDSAKQYMPPGTVNNGDYPLFNDNFISLTDKCGKEFYFIGYKGNVEVVREPYVFNHDCCHIDKVSGKRELIK